MALGISIVFLNDFVCLVFTLNILDSIAFYHIYSYIWNVHLTNHDENTPIQIYCKFYHQKLKVFS